VPDTRCCCAHPQHEPIASLQVAHLIPGAHSAAKAARLLQVRSSLADPAAETG
jgi:hypothetical protein